jgi:hypothetical protein
MLHLLFAVCALAAADNTLPKAQFLDGMKAGLPDTFCADKTYFRKCFTGTKEDCVKEIGVASGPCLEKFSAQMPAEFHQPADGQTWGQKVGECVGTKYETDLTAKLISNADCKDPAKWK